MRNFIKALRLMSILSEWSVKALEDGKVTSVEGAELVTEVCNILGVKAEIDFSDQLD